MSRFRFASPTQVALVTIAIVAFLISVVWFTVEPGFESILAFLGGVMALIPFISTNESSNNADTTHTAAGQNTASNRRYDYVAEPLPRPKSTHSRTSRRKTDRYQTIEDKLFDAFIPMKNWLLIILIVSLIAVSLLLIGAIAGGEGATVAFIGLIWLASVPGLYAAMIKRLYRRINLTGYYHNISTLAGREDIKDSLRKREWGNRFMDTYMPILVWRWLEPDKRKLNKFMRQFE